LSCAHGDCYLSEAQIEHISSKLLTQWKDVARIFIILTMIDKHMLIPLFLERRITDKCLPYDRKAIEALEIPRLGPSACQRFYETQRKLFDPIEYCDRKIQKNGTLREGEWESCLDAKRPPIWKTNSGQVMVLRVAHKESPEKDYALKLSKRTIVGYDRKTRPARELAILQRIEHANIVKLAGSFTTPVSIGMLISPVAEQNLEQYLCSNPMDDKMQRVLTGSFGCLIDAVCYLHHEGYVRHDDLKPRNILVHGDRVLLADFDSAMDWKETLQSTTPGANGWTNKYCSPEVISPEEFRLVRSSSDIWSLGCIFLEVATVLRGRKTKDLHVYLAGKGLAAYYQNPKITRGWIDAYLREGQTEKADDEPLNWVLQMMKRSPERRKSAWQLQKLVREKGKDSITGLPYHGPCCLHKSEEYHGSEQSRPGRQVPLAGETYETSLAIDDSAVAATGWSNEHVGTWHLETMGRDDYTNLFNGSVFIFKVKYLAPATRYLPYIF
jgi:serine/threonine protein kinase